MFRCLKQNLPRILGELFTPAEVINFLLFFVKNFIFMDILKNIK